MTAATDSDNVAHAASIAAHVERVVAEAPPLTPEQRDRIAAVLRAGGAS